MEFFNSADKYRALWFEITSVIESITDADMIAEFTDNASRGNKQKSISYVLNALLKERFEALDWAPESFIFAEGEYRSSNWRLDFAKHDISVEVGFNHGEAVAWNLIKPVIASELNHVKKAIQTSAGVVIAATENLKQAGGFDSAVGTYEKYVQYLKPLQQILSVPMVIVGLEMPASFHIEHVVEGPRKVGRIHVDD
jgi:Restriction endonuclease BglII